MDYSKFNSFYNLYDEDESLVNDFESNLRHITWQLFERQEEWLEMAGNNGEKYPRLKENAFDVMSQVYDESYGIMKWAVIYALVDMYYRDVNNLPDNIKHSMEEEFQHHYNDWPEDIKYDSDYHPIDERYTRPLFGFEEK